MSKSLSFFATDSDLRSLLAAVERQRPLRYAIAGTSGEQVPRYFGSGLDLPDLGVAKAGDPNREIFYLVVDATTDVRPRAVPQRRGQVRYAIEQQTNPRSVVLRPGGLFEEKCIIAGQVGTVSTDPGAVDLMKLFSKEIMQHFTKVKSYYLGNEASRLLNDGMRLTADVRAPAEYDLTRSGSPGQV